MSNFTWSTGYAFNWGGIVTLGNYLYAANYGTGSIIQTNLSDGTINNATWATGLNSPDGLVIDSTGTYMYVANINE